MPERTSRSLLKAPARCSACGGQWFREATFYGFLREEYLRIWEGFPDLVGQATLVPMTVGVCLCGTPLTPLIGGLRGGWTPNRELNRFLRALLADEEYVRENQGRTGPEAVQALERRITNLQRELGRRTRSRPGPGRYWGLPTRTAASGVNRTLTRDQLVLRLQEKGLDFRDARKVLDAILNAMIQSLRGGGNVRVPPLGTFEWKDRPQMRQRFRLGKNQTLFRQPRRVAFIPTTNLQIALDRGGVIIPREVTLPQRGQAQFCCERCGSTMFTEAHFRQYRQVPASLPGGDLVSVTEGLAIRALICICGHPIRLGRMRRQVGGDQARFEESFVAALRYRGDPKGVRQRQDFLATQLSRMEAVVGAIPRPT